VRRRDLLAGAVAAVAAPGGARAEAGRRVGVLFPGDIAAWEERVALVRRGIDEIVGGAFPVELVLRSGKGDPARTLGFADELAGAPGVGVVLALGSLALVEARRATSSVPIVALDLESDPLASGAAATLARPGGNVTGIFFDAPEIAGKWLQFLAELLPGLARVALLYDAQGDATQLEAAEASARVLGVATTRFGVVAPDDLPSTFGAIAGSRADAVLAHSSPIFVDNAERIARLALDHQLASIMLFPVYAKAGGLISYGPDNFALMPQAGAIVGRVLKGARPAELPIERPSRFTLLVNLATARALGLTVPRSLLLMADEVIE